MKYLGAPQEYEGGKGTAVAALFEVGPHVLALTRAKTGVLGAMLVKIDPQAHFAPGSSPRTPMVSDEIADLATEIGPERLERLIHALSHELAGAAVVDPRGIELTAAMIRVREAAFAGPVTGRERVGFQPGLPLTALPPFRAQLPHRRSPHPDAN